MGMLVNPYRHAVAGATPDPTIAALSPTAWYDPSILSSMFQDTAGSTPAVVDSPVARVNDLSGNGNTLLLTGISSNRPTLRSSGGLYWLEFSNTGTWLDCAGLTLTQANDFAAGAYSITSTARNIFDGTTTRQALVFSTTIGLYAGSATSAAGSVSLNTPYVFLARFNGASSLVRTNGSSTTVAATPGANGLSGLRVGTFSGTTGAFNGRLYFLLCRDTVFDATETTTVETYGKTKTGTTF